MRNGRCGFDTGAGGLQELSAYGGGGRRRKRRRRRDGSGGRDDEGRVCERDSESIYRRSHAERDECGGGNGSCELAFPGRALSRRELRECTVARVPDDEPRWFELCGAFASAGMVLGAGTVCEVHAENRLSADEGPDERPGVCEIPGGDHEAGLCG